MAMLAVKDIVRCPTCNSADVIYSCEPKCCFNHVCSECRTSFELATHRTGSALNQHLEASIQEPSSGDPAAPCAVCESLRLAVIESNGGYSIVCANCGAVLQLQYENVAAEL